LRNNATTNGAPADAAALLAAAQATPEDVIAEGTEGEQFFAAIRDEAEAARGQEYDGTLTAKMVTALGKVLSKPTPARYIKHIPPATGKPYESTGLASAQYQIDYMNAVFGRAHWRILPHYPPGKDGFLCKVVVVIGNNLAAASLDERGQLVQGNAEILGVAEGWGSVKNASSPADANKGSATNAEKRVIAEFGPGADVYRKEFDEENVGGIGDLHANNGQAAAAQSAARPASEPQKNKIRAKARAGGVDELTLTNILLWATGQQMMSFTSVEQSRPYLDAAMAQITQAHVDAILDAIDHQAQQVAASRAAHAQTQPAAQPVAQPVRRDFEHVGGSDIPTEPVGTAPLAPVPVAPPAQAA